MTPKTQIKLRHLHNPVLNVAQIAREIGVKYFTLKQRMHRCSPEITPEESRAIVRALRSHNVTLDINGGRNAHR